MVEEQFGDFFMNILFIGLGSIGQRHLRNIKKIHPKSKIFAFRRKFKTPLLNNNNKILKSSIKKKFKITYLDNLKNLDQYKINIGVICSPSSLHVEESIFLLRKKINIFVEKPLGSNLKNLNLLKRIARKSKKTAMVGFQLKFCPMIKYLQNIILTRKYGNINFISIHHGEHIKNFHKYENYKDLYASKKKLGGGVVLTQIHEIDYLLFLLKNFKLKKLNSISHKISDLKIDVEDFSSSIFSFQNQKGDKVICNLSLNYLEIPRKRKINLIFEKAKIEADLIKQQIIIYKNEKIKIIKKFKYKRNDLFINEMKYFLDKVKNKSKVDEIYGISNAIESLRLALQIKN